MKNERLVYLVRCVSRLRERAPVSPALYSGSFIHVNIYYISILSRTIQSGMFYIFLYNTCIYIRHYHCGHSGVCNIDLFTHTLVLVVVVD